MRAINLVPADSRPGRVNGGKSGGAVYGVFGVLIVLIAAASVFALAKRDEARANAELAAVQQSTDAYSRAATQYASFESAAKQANQRIETVRSLAGARFDWAGALRDLSRLVPESANISALTASVSDGAAATGGGSGGSTLRSSLPVPAIAMTGCSLTQNTVALLVNQLQAMRRVTNVTLASSKKAKETTSSGENSEQSQFEATGCTQYAFEIVVFFAPGNAKLSTSAVAGGGTTAVSTETAGTTPSTPSAGSN